MRKICLCLLLCLSLPLWGQDYIRRTYYGQGPTREIALQELMGAVEQAVRFQPSRLLESYRADISSAVVEQQQNGKLVLQLSGTTLDAIFQARQNRAADILGEGRKATDPSVRINYYRWAWYYMSSLPAGHQLPGKEEVQNWLLAHPDVKPASLPVPMTHIEREVAVLRGILGEIGPAAPAAPEKKVTESIKKEVTAPVPERIPIAAVPAAAPLLMPRFTPAPKAFSPRFMPRVSPILQKKEPWKTSILLTAGLCPEFLLGATVSVRKKWGVLAGFQSNFRPASASYSADSQGNAENGYIWPNGNSSVQHLRIFAGASRRVLPWMDVFATAGYGHRKIYWQDTEENWALMKDLSSTGPTLSVGLLLGFGHFSALLEANTVSFQTLGISLGLGVSF